MSSSTPTSSRQMRGGTSGKRLITLPWARNEKGGQVFIRWRLLLLYLTVLGAFAWLIGSSGLYFFIKYYSGYPEVRYKHIVGLPWTLDTYRKEKAGFFVEQGLVAAREGRWREAFEQLRLGVPKATENEEARLMLARIYLMLGRPDMARIILVQGLEHHTNQVEYLRTVLGFLFEQQADEGVIEVTSHLLSGGALNADCRRMMAIARIYAYFNRDQFESIKAVLSQDGLSNEIEGQFIEARIAWERGLRESALLQILALHDQAPKHVEIYRTLVSYLRESGRDDEARRLILRRQLAFPQEPEAYINYISLCADGDMKERSAAAIDDFLHQFGADPSALVKLSALAAQKGWADLAWKIVPLCEAQPRKKSISILQAIEAEIVRGAYETAADRAHEVAGQLSWLETDRTILTGLEGVALLGRGMEAEGIDSINRVISSAGSSASSLATLGKYLHQLNKVEHARRLLHRAVELDPLYQPALAELLQLELERENLDNVVPLIARLSSMRKPSTRLVVAIIKNLESDRYLFLDSRKEVLAALKDRISFMRGGLPSEIRTGSG